MTEDFQPGDAPIVSDAPAQDLPAPPSAIRDKPGLGALVVAVLLNWAALIALSVLVIQFEGGTMMDPGEDTPLRILAVTLLSTLATFLIVWYFVCRRYGKSLKEGLLLKGVERKTLKKWACISIVAAVAAGLIMMIAGEEEGALVDLLNQPGGLAVVALMAVLAPPFEEMYYRGLIQPVLTSRIGAAAVPISAAWFTSAHLFQLWGSWLGVAVIATMGLFFALLRHKYNSLLPSIVSHWCYNATLMVATFGQVALESMLGA